MSFWQPEEKVTAKLALSRTFLLLWATFNKKRELPSSTWSHGLIYHPPTRERSLTQTGPLRRLTLNLCLDMWRRWQLTDGLQQSACTSSVRLTPAAEGCDWWFSAHFNQTTCDLSPVVPGMKCALQSPLPHLSTVIFTETLTPRDKDGDLVLREYVSWNMPGIFFIIFSISKNLMSLKRLQSMSSYNSVRKMCQLPVFSFSPH